jgi:dodecin
MDKVYKQVRLVGCSAESVEKAVEIAISRASKTLEGLAWFEVVEIRGAIKENRPAEWQVTLNVGFKVEA